MQIGLRSLKPETVNWLRQELQRGELSRAALMARRVCREFGFRDSRGALQLASCQKALRSLHAAGRIQLPAPRHGGCHRCRPRRLGQAVPEPRAVPASAGAVQGLRLTEVTTQLQRRTWNEIVASERPQGRALF